MYNYRCRIRHTFHNFTWNHIASHLSEAHFEPVLLKEKLQDPDLLPCGSLPINHTGTKQFFTVEKKNSLLEVIRVEIFGRGQVATVG